MLVSQLIKYCRHSLLSCIQCINPDRAQQDRCTPQAPSYVFSRAKRSSLNTRHVTARRIEDLHQNLRRCTRSPDYPSTRRFSARGGLSRFRDNDKKLIRRGCNGVDEPSEATRWREARPSEDKPTVFQPAVKRHTYETLASTDRPACVCKHGEYLHLRVCGRRTSERADESCHGVASESNGLHGACNRNK